MTQPKISILIPCYNAEQWIKIAVDSALNQEIENKEIIVFDDESTDSSLEILQSYGEKITVKSGENRGCGPTKERLLELAQGEWIQILDADDELLPKKILHQLELVEDDTDFIYSPVIMRSLNGDSWSDIELKPNLDDDIYAQWIAWHVCQTNGVLWRASSLRALNGWAKDTHQSDDMEITFRALKKKFSVVYCPHAESIYRQWTNTSLSKSNLLEHAIHKRGLIEKFLKWLEHESLATERHYELAGESFFQLARYLGGSNLDDALRFARECQERGLFVIQGPAAQPLFMLFAKIFGYANAERIASFVRK